MDHLITPHGSRLVDLLVDERRASEIREQSRDWPSVDLGPRQLCDLELLIPTSSLTVLRLVTRLRSETARV